MNRIINARLESDPALTRSDWIPTDTPWDELNELSAEHKQVLQEIKDLGNQRIHQEHEYQREDAAQSEAVVTAHRDGVEPTLPKRTPQAKREATIEALLDTKDQKVLILRDLCREVVETVQDHQEEWSDAIRAKELEAEQRVVFLKQQLAAAEAEAQMTPKLRVWLRRCAVDRIGFHLPWSSLTQPIPSLLEIANQGRTPANSTPSRYLTQQTVEDVSVPAPGEGVVEGEQYATALDAEMDKWNRTQVTDSEILDYNQRAVPSHRRPLSTTDA